MARLAFTPWSGDAVYRLMISRTDLLGLGALVAWLEMRDPHWLKRNAKGCAAAGGGAVALFIALTVCDTDFEVERNKALYNTLGYSLVAVAFASTFVLARVRQAGWPHRLLCMTPVRYLGRISYMAYLTHLLGLDLARRLQLRGPLTVVVGLLLTIAIASISWYSLEQPLQRLRGRVSVSPRQGPVPVEGGREAQAVASR